MQTFKEYLDEHLEPFTLDDDDLITEKKKVTRIRKGKKQIVYVSTKPGYRMQDGKEVKMPGKEIMARRRAQKVAQRKRNTKMPLIQKKIKKSKQKAKRLGLDIGRPKE